MTITPKKITAILLALFLILSPLLVQTRATGEGLEQTVKNAENSGDPGNGEIIGENTDGGQEEQPGEIQDPAQGGDPEPGDTKDPSEGGEPDPGDIGEPDEGGEQGPEDGDIENPDEAQEQEPGDIENPDEGQDQSPGDIEDPTEGGDPDPGDTEDPTQGGEPEPGDIGEPDEGGEQSPEDGDIENPDEAQEQEPGDIENPGEGQNQGPGDIEDPAQGGEPEPGDTEDPTKGGEPDPGTGDTENPVGGGDQVPPEPALPEMPAGLPPEGVPPAADASISIRLDADKAEYEMGDVAEFTVTVTNTGDADIVGLWVYGENIGIETEIPSLPAGDEETIRGKCYIPYGYSRDSFTVDASAEGRYGGGTVSAGASLTLPVNRIIFNPAFVEVQTDSVIPVPLDYEEPSTETPESTDPAPLNASLPMMAAAQSANSYPDTITVNKTAQVTQGCRAFEVNLSITGTPPDIPLDVILVIDTSYSMADGNPSSLYYAKQAAINFAEQVLADPDNRVAVVEFYYDGWGKGDLYDDTNINRNFTNNFNQVKNAINGLVAGGGTNTQAGFRRAKNLMEDDGRSNANRVIILLTDGVPTISIGRSYGPNEPTSHNAHTTAAYTEGQSSWSIAKVFTVGLLRQVPSQCLGVARDTLQRAQNAGYYETMSDADLSDIYEQIASQLGTSATNAVVTDVIPEEFELVEGSFVTDPDAPVSYNEATRTITWTPGAIGTSSTLTYKIKAKKTFGGGENVATNVSAILTYTDVNGTGKTKTFPVPRVNVPAPLSVNPGPDRQIFIGETIGIGDNLQVTGGYQPYSYHWTSSGEPAWSSTEQNPRVSPEHTTTYTITVTDNYGCRASGTVTITVIKGKIIIEKIVTNENTDKEFVIKVDGPNGKKWNVFAAEGETHEIGNLWPGAYHISEVVPMDYSLVSISPSTVNISSSNRTVTVTVKNERSNNGWFRDEDEEDNFFTLEVGHVEKSAEEQKDDGEILLEQAVLEAVLPENQKGPEEKTDE